MNYQEFFELWQASDEVDEQPVSKKEEESKSGNPPPVVRAIYIEIPLVGGLV